MKRAFMIGAGGIAGRHAAALRQVAGVEVAGVCDLDRSRAEKIVAQHRLPAVVFTDAAQGLDAICPDYVVLLTPRTVRLPVVKLCVERRLPLFMEKPPCHNLATGREIERLLIDSRLIHSVGFPTRYHEALNATLERLAGELLALIQISMTAPFVPKPLFDACPDPYLVARSGGIAGDQGIHYVDIARYIARAGVKTVRAVGSNRGLMPSPQVTTRDNAGWLLEMENGIVVTHAHTWCASGWGCQIRLVTDRSDVTVDGFEGQAAGTVNGEAFAFGPAQSGILAQFVGEHRMFLEAVETGDMRPVRSDYTDALESFRVTEEINRQLYGGQ
jgi:predicted dehydrogenase